MENQIVVMRQAPIIEEHLVDAKNEVIAKTEFAKSLICTVDSLKKVKETRAELNKDFAYLESVRKEIKRAILLPYEEFERKYKEYIATPYKQADSDLKAKIAEVEDGIKQQREAEVIAYFDEYKAARHLPFIRFADSGITVGLSGSKKSLKEQAAAFVDKVAGDVEFIQRTQPDDADEILLEYRSSLSVTYSVDKVLRRKQALIQQRRQREEQQAVMQAEAQAAQKVQEITEPHPPEMVAPPVEVQAPVVEEQATEPVQPQEQQENTQSIKLYRVSFDVIGSLEQLKELKKFLVSKNLLVNGGLNHEH